jgi:hypothetical protein
MVSKYTLKMQGRRVLVVWFLLSKDKDRSSYLANSAIKINIFEMGNIPLTETLLTNKGNSFSWS